MPEPVRLYTVSEAAAEAHISVRTVYRELKAGHIRAVKVRRCTRITSRELTAYLARLPRRAA